ncbi:MAG TPA: COX15/CtaA family protein [Candidatus Nitrosotalea sp.]|nr:COX15/CtaA family protein [Candidatus Nitrosotalea sp.]
MKPGFRVLAIVTAICAYAQIALGGVVRTSGSGLGCRDQWPLCNGHPYPGWNVHAIIEYSHRTFGAVTAILMLATFVAAVVLYRRGRPLLAWLSGGALAAVSLEIPLGALVVFRDLAGLLVVAHLMVAMLTLGLLLATAVAASAQGWLRRRAGTGFLLATALLAYFTLLTGAGVVATGADNQCHAWPLCGSGLIPDFSGVNAFTMIHRLTVAGLIGLAAWTAWRHRREPDRTLAGWSTATVAVILIQAAIGIGAAFAVRPTLFDSLHVALAAAAWGTAATAFLLALDPGRTQRGGDIRSSPPFSLH